MSSEHPWRTHSPAVGKGGRWYPDTTCEYKQGQSWVLRLV